MSSGMGKMPMLPGFLLVELLIGLVVVALVMMGAAAIMAAVAQGWTDQDITRSTQLQANQVYARVQNALQQAKFIGYINAGNVNGNSAQPGCIFFWQNDNFGGVEAGEARIGEMALIIQDPTTNSLWLYQCVSNPADYSAEGAVMPFLEMNQSTAPAQFEALNFVQAQCLGGPGNTPDDGTRLHINGFQVDVQSLGSTTQLPVIEFALGFSRSDGTSLTLYNTTTVRGPATQPE
jgi:type II secretory pathway pseudopilin PulG